MSLLNRFGRFFDKNNDPGAEDFELDAKVWNQALGRLPIFGGLSSDEKERLYELAKRFIYTKQFHFFDGLLLPPWGIPRIAALAALPILNLGIDHYKTWTSLLLVPESYEVTKQWRDEAGVEFETSQEIGGEVLDLGPVRLVWQDVKRAGSGDAYNVVIHELAHKLDDTNGEMDGLPLLEPPLKVSEWREVLSRDFEDFRDSLGDAEEEPEFGRGGIDSYAADSPEEFFAVLCEYFFERPRQLKRTYPDTYRLFTCYFRQDPSVRHP